MGRQGVIGKALRLCLTKEGLMDSLKISLCPMLAVLLSEPWDDRSRIRVQTPKAQDLPDGWQRGPSGHFLAHILDKEHIALLQFH